MNDFDYEYEEFDYSLKDDYTEEEIEKLYENYLNERGELSLRNLGMSNRDFF